MPDAYAYPSVELVEGNKSMLILRLSGGAATFPDTAKATTVTDNRNAEVEWEVSDSKLSHNKKVMRIYLKCTRVPRPIADPPDGGTLEVTLQNAGTVTVPQLPVEYHGGTGP